jgi:magnesium chelatase subunit D
VLAAADGGLVVLPMAERMTEATAARIAAALDARAVEDARVRIAVVALDDGVEDESVPRALVERLAFRIDLSGCRVSDVYASPAQAGAQSRDDGGMAKPAVTAPCATGPRPAPGKEEGGKDEMRVAALGFETDPSGYAASNVDASYADASPAQAGAQSRNDGGMAQRAMTAPRATGPRPSPGKEEGETHGRGKENGETRNAGSQSTIDPHAILAATALALGVESARAPLFALRAARAAAALAGRETIDADDLFLAVRLVLAPRATRLPAPPKADNASDPPLPPPESNSSEEERATPDLPEDMILEAALATLPRDVLEQLAAGRGRRGGNRARGAGERRKSPLHGRPLGARAGVPRGGLRLSLIDTLRAAAPWQALRARGDGPVRIRRDDLRIRRFETRAETLTIFAVDASGSAAVARLAEAKGAVELLLAQAYVKRAQVALIAFRGAGAELMLPPTRSLTRARRALAELPGGGGTPLAAGLETARTLAEAARARGRTPFLVVLTDGRGNIALDGSAVRERAEHDAEQAARAIGQAGIGAAFVDTSARPRPEGARLALAMGARYLPLPRADAAAMHRAVSAVQAA